MYDIIYPYELITIKKINSFWILWSFSETFTICIRVPILITYCVVSYYYTKRVNSKLDGKFVLCDHILKHLYKIAANTTWTIKRVISNHVLKHVWLYFINFNVIIIGLQLTGNNILLLGNVFLMVRFARNYYQPIAAL